MLALLNSSAAWAQADGGLPEAYQVRVLLPLTREGGNPANVQPRLDVPLPEAAQALSLWTVESLNSTSSSQLQAQVPVDVHLEHGRVAVLQPAAPLEAKTYAVVYRYPEPGSSLLTTFSVGTSLDVDAPSLRAASHVSLPYQSLDGGWPGVIPEESRARLEVKVEASEESAILIFQGAELLAAPLSVGGGPQTVLLSIACPDALPVTGAPSLAPGSQELSLELTDRAGRKSTASLVVDAQCRGQVYRPPREDFKEGCAAGGGRPLASFSLWGLLLGLVRLRHSRRAGCS